MFGLYNFIPIVVPLTKKISSRRDFKQQSLSAGRWKTELRENFGRVSTVALSLPENDAKNPPLNIDCRQGNIVGYLPTYGRTKVVLFASSDIIGRWTAGKCLEAEQAGQLWVKEQRNTTCHVLGLQGVSFLFSPVFFRPSAIRQDVAVGRGYR